MSRKRTPEAARALVVAAMAVVEEGIRLGLARDGMDPGPDWHGGGATPDERRAAWARERARNIGSALTAIIAPELLD